MENERRYKHTVFLHVNVEGVEITLSLGRDRLVAVKEISRESVQVSIAQKTDIHLSIMLKRISFHLFTEKQSRQLSPFNFKSFMKNPRIKIERNAIETRIDKTREFSLNGSLTRERRNRFSYYSRSRNGMTIKKRAGKRVRAFIF